MRARFREWYSPTDEEVNALWSDAFFALDSNVLLELYQYPTSAREEFLGVLKALQGRLWLPYQAGLEYQIKREASLPQQRRVLEALISNIEGLASKVDRLGLPEYHPVLDVERFEHRRTTVRNALDSLMLTVQEDLAHTPEFSARVILDGDPLRDELTDLFNGAVGERFSKEEFAAICIEGATRYDKEVPPGFKDSDKPEPQRYHDLVIWREVLREGASRGGGRRSAILVTNDRKEDWWLRKAEQILGPRPELVREYMDTTGGDFYMYTPAAFLEQARHILGIEISAGTIEAVDRVSSISAIEEFLRFQRMTLPAADMRAVVLGRIYDALEAGAVRVADDINAVVDSLDESLRNSYTAVPLFFALVNEVYGLLRPTYDPDLRLRDRLVPPVDSIGDRTEFVFNADAAWVAQALYRLRYKSFTDEALLAEFFGEDYDEVAVSKLQLAREYAQKDIDRRGS